MLKRMFLKVLFFSMSVVLFSACGGGGETSSTENDTHTGVFLDSSVEGIKYKTSSGVTGFTNQNGEYEYKQGDTVEFFVGNVSLGEVTAKDLISVLELENSEQSAMLLQALDSDLNPDNGINISQETFELFENSTLDISSVNESDENFQQEYKAITGKEFQVDGTSANEHATDALRLENLKAVSDTLYNYYIGDINYDGYLTNKTVLQSMSSKRLNLYNYFYLTSLELDLMKANAKKQIDSNFDTLEIRKNAIATASSIVAEGIALSSEPVVLSEKMKTNFPEFDKEQLLEYGEAIIEEEYPNLPDGVRTALFKELSLVYSCADMFGKPSRDEVLGCVNTLSTDFLNTANDAYSAWELYSSAKALNTLTVVEQYLTEYFFAGEQKSFMYERYGITGATEQIRSEALIQKLKESTLVKSNTFWTEGEYLFDDELFKELTDKFILETRVRSNRLVQKYHLKINYDTLTHEHVNIEVTGGKYNVATNEMTACYVIENNSYFDINNITLDLQIDDEALKLVSKELKLPDIHTRGTQDEACVNIPLSSTFEGLSGMFFNIQTTLNYQIASVQNSSQSNKHVYLSENDLFDLLKKITPPHLELHVDSDIVEDGYLLVSASGSSVDSSQGTLSYNWQQVQSDGYEVELKRNINTDTPDIYLPSLPNGSNQKTIWIDVTATASLSAQSTTKRLEIVVKSNEAEVIQNPVAYAGEDLTVNINEAVNFNGKNTNTLYEIEAGKSDADILWEWYDENNNLISTDKSFTKTFKEVGAYLFTLVVRDRQSANEYMISSDDINVTVNDTAIEVEAVVTNFYPTAANQNERTTFTIVGENLPDTLAMSLAGSVENSCQDLAVSSTQATISCIPGVSGTQIFYVAKESGGDAVNSDVTLSVDVQSVSLGAPDFTNTTCYDAPTNPFDQWEDEWFECTRYAYGRACEQTGTQLTYTQDYDRNGGAWYNLVSSEFERGSEPRANSIAVWSDGNYGHVAYVESVNVDTDIVTISEANWDADTTTATYSGTKELTLAEMQTRGSQSQYKLVGYVYLTKYPTVSLQSVTAITTGEEATFVADLSTALDSQYSLKISLGDGGGGYLEPTAMTANSTRDSFSYSAAISKAGNRVYKIAVFDSNNIQMTEWVSGTYVVNEVQTSNFNPVTVFGGKTFYMNVDGQIIQLTFNSDATELDNGTEVVHPVFDGNRVTFSEDTDGSYSEIIEVTDEYVRINDYFANGTQESVAMLYTTEAAASSSTTEVYEMSIVYNFVSGQIDYRDGYGQQYDIPDDMYVRIVPSSLQNDVYGWDGPLCKVNSDGSFGQECYMFNEQVVRNAFANASQTYQVVVYKEHINPYGTTYSTWNCGEDVYDYVGDGMSNGSWSNITVMKEAYQDNSGQVCNNDTSIPETQNDSNVSIEQTDNTLTVNISLSGNTLTAVFNKDMQEGFSTTGEYNPEASYWVDTKTFKIDFTSYTSGGTLVLKADGFQTTEGKFMTSDVSFTFPEQNVAEGSSLIDHPLIERITISRNPDSVAVYFKVDMLQEGGYLTGDIAKSGQYWLSPRYFVVEGSFTKSSGGSIQLLSHQFQTLDGEFLEGDFNYNLP